jgi:hypothetical protein
LQVFSSRIWTAHNAYLQNDWELVYVEKRMYLIYYMKYKINIYRLKVGVNPDLYYNVFGESMLNDGVAIVLYYMMIAFAGEAQTAQADDFL